MITREISYVVQPGDTVYLIARKFNTTVAAIAAANNLVNPALIYPGQVLRIPVTGIEYVVKPGDTVYSIATMFGLPYYTIIYVNNLVYPYTIYPGQVLFIPTTTPIPTPVPPYPTPCQMIYTVKPGDTMWNIAQMYGIPLDYLIRANPQIPNPNLIYPGQLICIPANCPPVDPAKVDAESRGFSYIVKPGDTLWTIAQMFGTTVDAILKANPGITNPNLIYPGMVIRIPGGTTPPAGTTYVVKPGDTLYEIAKRFGVSLDALLKANPQITDPNLIYPGMVITIPVVRTQEDTEKEEEKDE